MKKLTKAIALAGAMSVAAFANADDHSVEVAASVDIASSYLWRGTELGTGVPVVSGDLSASAGGAYAGVWVSSGDTAFGTEYDLYAGYALEAGDVAIDFGLVTYSYPGSSAGVDNEGTTFDWTEFYVGLGFENLSASITTGEIADGGLGQYLYSTVGAEFGDYAVTLGNQSAKEGTDYLHLDLSYTVSDVTFTFSKIVEAEDESMDDDLKIVASYSLPLGM